MCNPIKLKSLEAEANNSYAQAGVILAHRYCDFKSDNGAPRYRARAYARDSLAIASFS